MWETNMSQRRSLTLPCLALDDFNFICDNVVSRNDSEKSYLRSLTRQVLTMFWKKYTPAYPVEAIREHMQGSGVLRMIDKTAYRRGRVIEHRPQNP